MAAFDKSLRIGARLDARDCSSRIDVRRPDHDRPPRNNTDAMPQGRRKGSRAMSRPERERTQYERRL
jgi:hypothetical protein